MSFESLATVVGLVLILEGIMPLLIPAQWREFFMQVAQLKDGQIRTFGLGFVVAGLLVLLIL